MDRKDLEGIGKKALQHLTEIFKYENQRMKSQSLFIIGLIIYFAYKLKPGLLEPLFPIFAIEKPHT